MAAEGREAVAEARAGELLERIGGLERIVGPGVKREQGTDTVWSRQPQPTTPSHRLRKQASSGCDLVVRSQEAMAACCPMGGAHRRLSETANCALPSVCPTMSCATVFESFLTYCRSAMVDGGLNVADFDRFNTQCGELAAQSVSMGLALQPANVQMFRVLVSTDTTASPPSPSPPSPSVPVQEYHAVCSSAAINDCVPSCNATTHGFELLATIDGTDTKFSCNVAHGLFSWMGAATEGGYLGADSTSFFSAVVSGAAGSYFVTLMTDAGIGTDLAIRPGQDVQITGDAMLLTPPYWGSGGFAVDELGKLSLQHVTLNNRITVAQGFAGLSIRGCNGPNGPRMSGNLSTSSGGNIRSVPIAFALSLPSARWSSVGATNVGVSTSSQGFGDLSLDAAGNTYVLFLMPPTTFPSLVCASQQRCGEDFQTPRIATGIEQKKYADICASAGLRPIIGGTIMMNTPGYCSQ